MIYVWHGPDTLKNYKPGIVIVPANNETEAWDKLKALNFRIWFWLQTGVPYVYTPDDAKYIDLCNEWDQTNYPQHPTAYEPDKLPVFIVVGG